MKIENIAKLTASTPMLNVPNPDKRAGIVYQSNYDEVSAMEKVRTPLQNKLKLL